MDPKADMDVASPQEVNVKPMLTTAQKNFKDGAPLCCLKLY